MLARATAACLLLAAIAAGCGDDGGGIGASPLTGAWEAPVDVSRPGDHASGPRVAVDGSGDAVAVWTATPGENASAVIVQSAARPVAGSWQRPVTISTRGSASSPEIAVDAKGNAIAAWTSYSRHRSSVQAAARPAGGRWSAPVRLSAAGETAAVPHVAFDARGNALAVWQRTRAGRSSIRSARRPAGGRWGRSVAVARISPGGGAEFATPRVAVDAKGNAAAVWTNVTSGNMGAVQAALKPAGGAWRAPATLSAGNGRSFAAQVVIDGAGNVVAAWLDYTGRLVRAAVHAPGGHWGRPKLLSRPRRVAGGPMLATGGRATTIAVWPNLAYASVASATRRAGGGWQAPVDVAGGVDAFSTPVALDADGDAVAVWIGDDGGSEQGAVRAAGGGWQAPADLAPRLPGIEASGANISVAVDPAGRNAVAVWSRPIGAGSVVQATARPLAG